MLTILKIILLHPKTGVLFLTALIALIGMLRLVKIQAFSWKFTLWTVFGLVMLVLLYLYVKMGLPSHIHA